MDKTIEIVRSFNSLILDTISGPDCTDPNICRGDCCFIQMHLPKSLAKELIRFNLAKKSDFIRGMTFSFQIQIDLTKLRCIFYDHKINGCALHQSQLKPPQCWLYPTGLDPETADTTCKKAGGWQIINPQKAKQLQILLDNYIILCKEEATFENSPEEIKKRLRKLMVEPFPTVPPYKIAGVIDGWDDFTFWESTGYSFAMQKFCSKLACPKSYLHCEHACPLVLQEVCDFFNENLPQFIQENGFRRKYSLLEVLQWHGKL